MFDPERLQRVARAIEDERFFERYRFMPDATYDAHVGEASLRIARVAILAADGDVAALERLRASREDWLDLFLAEPTTAMAERAVRTVK